MLRLPNHESTFHNFVEPHHVSKSLNQCLIVAPYFNLQMLFLKSPLFPMTSVMNYQLKYT
jgi:hypothetical protein